MIFIFFDLFVLVEEEISQETKIEEKDEEIQKEKSDKEPEITLESLW